MKGVKPLNPNIEIINPDLWAVRFSFIPYINEIDYKPDDKIAAYKEPGRITNDGLLIINKDYAGYPILKDLFPKLMKKKDRKLVKELNNALKAANKTEWENLYASMIQVEMERRIKRRKGVN